MPTRTASSILRRERCSVGLWRTRECRSSRKRPRSDSTKNHSQRRTLFFIMKDPVEKDETYYVHKMNDLMEIGGHYTYYEKNPCMQNYMISSRKKNGAFPTETVEDRAAKDFRNMVRKRGGGPERKKIRRFNVRCQCLPGARADHYGGYP